MDHGFGGKGKDGMLCVMVCVCVCVKRSIFCSFVRVCAWVRVVLGAGSGGHGSVGVGVGRWAGGVGWGRGGGGMQPMHRVGPYRVRLLQQHKCWRSGLMPSRYEAIQCNGKLKRDEQGRRVSGSGGGDGCGGGKEGWGWGRGYGCWGGSGWGVGRWYDVWRLGNQ